jgi:hypothetical protein
MSFRDRLSVAKIKDAASREHALDVLSAVYKHEKRWVEEREKLLPAEDIGNEAVSWFAVSDGDHMLGVTRVLYEIPVDLYKAYGFKLKHPGLDVEAFIANNRIAEIGRFAVLPEFRNQIFVAGLLMKAAAWETIERGFTHFITDVFEDDPNTPHGFHQRVLGFQEVATHEVGELKTDSRRITMLLDLAEAKARISNKKGWFFKFLTDEPDKQAAAQ